MKLSVLFSLFFLFLSLPNVNAQETTTPSAMLTEEYVDRFILTVEPMTKELEELGMESKNGDNEWATTEKGMAILEDYGWTTESYIQKAGVIAIGMAYHAMMLSIDAMPADEKEQAEAVRSMYETQIKVQIHPNDLELIGSKMDALMAIDFEDD